MSTINQILNWNLFFMVFVIWEFKIVSIMLKYWGTDMLELNRKSFPPTPSIDQFNAFWDSEMLCISITPTWKLVLYHKMACIIKNRVEILFYSFNLCLGISIYALSISIKFCILCFITFNSRLYAWRGIHSRYLCRCCYIISLSPSILLYVSTVQWKVGGITHFYGYVVVTHLIPREGIRFYLLYRLVFL